MPNVTTIVSYQSEEFGANEVSSFSRDVEDLDVHSALWYCVRILETMGYQCDQLQMISGDKIYKTDW
jgi:hypothetical protein